MLIFVSAPSRKVVNNLMIDVMCVYMLIYCFLSFLIGLHSSACNVYDDLFGMEKVLFASLTLGRICFSSLDNKIVCPISDSQNRSHSRPERFEGELAAYFLLFFILTKFLKNHS